MLKMLEKLEVAMDRCFERKARQHASEYGRRSFISKVGMTLIGAGVVPMLPFDRYGEAHAASMKDRQSSDPMACDYWRYCALSGRLCSCCGGGPSTCPAGSEPSKVSWIGTCENPDDKRNYLVSYNDCCGKVSCDQCACQNHEQDKPGYRMGLNSGISWCMANDSSSVHCTVAVIVGLGDSAPA